MKVSFDKKSLNITSKRFNPFKFSIYGIDVITEKNEREENPTDPFKMLENLAAVKKPKDDANAIEKVKTMHSVLNK